MIKINISDHGKMFSSTMPWQYDVRFENKTDKTIKYVTFYLAKKNSDGSYIHNQTGFRLCVGEFVPGDQCYRQITTDWFDPEYGPRDISLYSHAILEYSDGTKEHIYSDEISYEREGAGFTTFAVILFVIAMIFLCISMME